VRAKKSLGQNFLVDPNLQRRIVDSLDPAQEDTVVEIGPGQGALTHRLAELGLRLIAVELDHHLAADLRTRFAPMPRVTIVHGDALQFDPVPLLREPPVKVVGNIPYNITSPLLFRLLEWRPPPERIVVMVQKEVADRLLADPGEKAYGALTVGVRAQATVQRLFNVGPRAFRPAPSVDSTVVLIRPRPDLSPEVGVPLRALTRAAFGMRRKQLQKILRTAPGYCLEPARAERILASVGVRPADRPETLSPATFVALAAELQRHGYP
jgi:16S rRNA (adenine1518-N6/adenine1519-N6)-dimethyltransferase